jgi:opacity protein-like surface antigen
MKKALIVVTFLLAVELVTAQSSSSHIALNVYGSYVFKDRVEFDRYTGYVSEGLQYGAGLEYFVDKTASVELKYLRHDGNFPLYGPTGEQQNKGKDDGSVNYVLLEGTGYYNTHTGSNVIPFGGFGLGVGILDGKSSGNSTTKFAWDARLGLKFKTGSRFSINVQTSLQSIVAAIGSDFYYAAGGGVITFPDYATLLQFGLGGGISLHF